ncbi:MAG TPA: DUF4382 domain-containing protein [Armatimonadota bacterium]|jgi:hypothetical protein
MRLWFLVGGLLGLMLLFIAGCGGGSSSSGSTARVKLLLGDAPVVLPDGTTVDSVNVPITRIVLLGQADNEATAVVLYDGGNAPTPLDLLSLANQSLTALQQSPIATSLGTVSVPAGHYTQMRLVLGSGATAMVNGAPIDLKVPSGMETGLKVKVNLDLGAATLQEVFLDFNLSKLNYQPGPNRFILPPNALRLVKLTQTANITGTVTVTPPAGGVTGDVAVKLTLCDATGNPVLVNGVPDATIDTQVLIPQNPATPGDYTAVYTLNAIPTSVGSYQLLPTVQYGGTTLVQTLNPAVNVTVTGGQTTTQNISIALE